MFPYGNVIYSLLTVVTSRSNEAWAQEHYKFFSNVLSKLPTAFLTKHKLLLCYFGVDYNLDIFTTKMLLSLVFSDVARQSC